MGHRGAFGGVVIDPAGFVNRGVNLDFFVWKIAGA
jgi:hypothetical protein